VIGSYRPAAMRWSVGTPRSLLKVSGFVAHQMSATVADSRGLWATCSVVHKSTAGCRSGSRSQFGVIARVSRGIIIGQPMRPVEDRQAPVGILVHAHGGAHKMRPQRARRDLQGQAAPLDGIVIAYPALLVDAQDVARRPVRSRTKALPASAGATAKAALWASQ
jgi:hypothetical protein